MLLAGEQAVILGEPADDPRPSSALAGPTVVPGPHPERSYPQGVTTLQGETVFQQPDRRMHRTGLDCTSLHRFRATAIFYPNFFPKVQQS
jgi:hypothetical protein